MRPWEKHTNDDLALNLEVWLDLDGKVSTERQRKFFEEIIWRLLMTDNPLKEKENIDE